MNLIRGFQTTFRHVLEEPVTIQYPEEMLALSAAFQGAP